MKHIREIVLKYNIQIVNAQSSFDRYSSTLAKWLYKLPVKVIHTRRQRSKSEGGFFKLWLYQNKTDKIIAVCNGVKESLMEIKIPPNHIKVIFNGTPKEKYEHVDFKLTEKLKKFYNIDKEDFVIGCVSRKKNQEQIIEALALLPFSTKMIFVGIEEEPEYKKLTEKLKNKHEIYFTGLVPTDHVLSYYLLFTIKILASTIEGISQSILEAMALGVPVIATNSSGNSEIINHGQNGYLFPDNNIKLLAETITKLYYHPELRSQFSYAAKKTAFSDFSIEKTIANYESFFEEIIMN